MLALSSQCLREVCVLSLILRISLFLSLLLSVLLSRFAGLLIDLTLLNYETTTLHEQTTPQPNLFLPIKPASPAVATTPHLPLKLLQPDTPTKVCPGKAQHLNSIPFAYLHAYNTSLQIS